MISFEEMRETEPELEKVSDEDLERIRSLLYVQARLAMDCLIGQKEDSKKIASGSWGSEEEMKKLPPCKTEE